VPEDGQVWYLSEKQDDSAETWAKAHPPGFALAFNFQPQQSIIQEVDRAGKWEITKIHPCPTLQNYVGDGFEYFCASGWASAIFSPVN
jgi:hypothetical protein